ncbi:MAG: hypothetical protein FWD70_03900 [Desulfuromonadales bacterium]|nr:hypothetical protein [Desulfuromonadales bacterium]
MIEFIKNVFSDTNGMPSSNRVAMLMVIICLLICAFIIVNRTGAIPAIPDSWIVLVGLTIGGVSVGKLPTVLTAIFNKAAEEKPTAQKRGKNSVE